MRTPHRHGALRRLCRRGFTFAELLVAVVLASIVLLSVYFVFVTGTEQYYRQEQIVQMQEGMRFAMEYIKNDLRNAGMLAVANGHPQRRDPGLCRPNADLRGVQLFDDEQGNRPLTVGNEAVPGILTDDPNSLRPDRVRVLVDATGGIPLVTSQVNGARVDLQAPRYQVTEAAKKLLQPTAQARFESMYREGFYLHIRSVSTNAFDLVPIDDVDFRGGSPRLTLARNVCLEVVPCNGDCIVNPVQLVEYAIVEDADAGGTKTDLQRRVIDANNRTTPLPELSLTIAEYVVNLQIWGTYDSRDDSSQVPMVRADPDLKDDVGNWPGVNDEAAIMNLRPERLRGLNVLIATRTPREDPAFNLAIDLATPSERRVPSDRTWFEVVEAAGTGYAHVATLTAEVRTPNLFKGL